MSRIRSLIAGIMVGILVLSQVFVSGVPTADARLDCGPSFPANVSNRVFDLVNNYRVGIGYNRLTRLQSLDGVGASYSQSAAWNGSTYYWPTPYWDLYPAGYSYQSVVRNTDNSSNCDVEASATRIVTEWKESSSSRGYILDPALTHMGVGGASSSNYVWMSVYFGEYPVVKPATTASLAVNPTSGTAGAIVAVTGRGYPAATQVELRWAPTNTLIGRVTTDQNGAFSGKVTVPSAPIGTHQIRARVVNTTISRTAGYTVTATSASMVTTITPSTAPAGSVVTISGRGFSAYERVQFRYLTTGGTLMGYVTARSDGSFSGKVTLPGGTTGSKRIYAVGVTSKRAGSGTVTITAPVRSFTVSPTSAQAGSVIRFSGSGFTPGETVDIRWGTYQGSLLGSVKASTSGSISGAITVPRTASGSSVVVARGRSSSLTMSARISVTRVTAARVVAPSVLVTPGSVALGQPVQVQAAGFEPDENVVISIGTIQLATAKADKDGQVQATVTVPSDLPFADQAQTVNVTGEKSKREAEASLTILDPYGIDATLSPDQGPEGSVTTIEATGYAPGELVEVRIGRSDGRVAARLTADADGKVSGKITVPQGKGTVELVLVGDKGHPLGKATFTYGAAEPTPAGTPTVVPTTTPDPTPAGTPDVAPTVEVPEEPVGTPDAEPTEVPTETPTEVPTEIPTEEPTEVPTETPTEVPTETPTEVPTETPTEVPTEEPTEVPTEEPTEEPTAVPTEVPTEEPVAEPTGVPAGEPTVAPVEGEG